MRSSSDGTHRRPRAPPDGARPRAEARPGVVLGRAHRRRRSSARPPAALRAAGWSRARAAGIDAIPSGDFSLYDHVLDTAWAVGAIPERLGGGTRRASTPTSRARRGTAGARPLEMTKWFDTNYHYLVPELAARPALPGTAGALGRAAEQARRLGVETRPVVLGPVTFLLLSKGLPRPLDALDALDARLRRAAERAVAAGAARCRSTSRASPSTGATPSSTRFAAWRALADGRRPRGLPRDLLRRARGRALDEVLTLPAAEVHLDLVRAPEQLGPRSTAARRRGAALARRRRRPQRLGGRPRRRPAASSTRRSPALGEDRVTIAPSCSLLHVPYAVAREASIPDEVRGWLASPREQLAELGRPEAAVAAPGERDALLAEPARGVAARAGVAPAPATRRCARASPPSARPTTTRAAPLDVRRSRPAGAHAAARAADHHDRLVPPDRRDPRRPPRPARGTLGPPNTSASSRSGWPRWSPMQEDSVWTCSCTASPSATTWSSTSASSCAASPSPSTAGCSRTGAAA